ncbi:MAG: [acyl-carrier-protein] S-malonyltransferase [Dehalococcoidia bacterium]|nr:[acyl-carrier-protein] S-malonyltransferase [Dehalococcoidia bacterium]HCV00417.1 [acyl-carrier-protein] S-malonyltransferase [Dehalococcoidia bacterium]|tara:strand:- start:14076 stop:15068 length:993 start_codon:yes stop_codon:yes gene_type:complete
MQRDVGPWRRIALIFPGQGSHSVGMGKRLYHASQAAKEVFRRADEVLETKLSSLCFEGPEDELERTINQQPATFVISIAWLEALKERWATIDRKLQPHVVAGHSMGEFTAAVAAGSLEFEEGLLLVRERGRAMDEAGQENPGGMASILGLSEESVSAICEEANGVDGYVGIATLNCEGQHVISGAIKPLMRAMDAAQEAGARKVVRLPITIASHSPLMQRASETMGGWLDRFPPREPQAPLVGNINGDVLRSQHELDTELRGQLTSIVRWQRGVERMQELGADLFVEVGPGNVLTKLVRRIDPKTNVVSLSDSRTGLLSDRFDVVESATR